MKRATFFFFILFLLNGYAMAQYESRKGYAGISVGPSLPLGDFGSKNVNLETAAFAKTGGMLNLNFAYRIASNFGVTAMLLMQVNGFDDKAVLEGFKKNINPNIISVDADSWSLSGLMAGGFASIPLDSKGKIIVEPRAMVSLLTVISPRIKVTGKDGFYTISEEQQAGIGAAIGFNLGGGLRFNMSDRIAILLNADYLKANPKFIDVEYRFSNGTVNYFSFQQKIEVVNIGLGFAIRIKKDEPPVRRRVTN